MKKIKYIAVIIVLAFTVSCEDFLKEDPKSLLTAQYLETEAGVNSALYSAYSDLRYIYGGESAMNATCSGTDEWQKGPDGNANFNLYQTGMAADGAISGLWNWGFTAINTSNAVIKYAPLCGMDEEEVTKVTAEAKFLRATWYFLIVQTFGACPVNLDFIQEPSTEAYRDPVADVYAAIVADLEEAKSVLPAQAEETGRADAAVATHLLAKVYLTRATTQGANAASDYQQAYNNAMELISNKGLYGLELEQDFAKVFDHAMNTDRKYFLRSRGIPTFCTTMRGIPPEQVAAQRTILRSCSSGRTTPPGELAVLCVTSHMAGRGIVSDLPTMSLMSPLLNVVMIQDI
mgnify:CR=1 FL=1